MDKSKFLVTTILGLGLVATIGIHSTLATHTFADGDSDSWSYSSYSHGSYVPKSGTTFLRF